MTPDHACPVCGQDNDPSGPGCDCYGDPEPHYPSTAELAAFRTFMTQGRIVHMSFSDYATDAEARHGIGWTARSLAYGVTPPGITIHTAARRDASALRSRAFARVDDALKTDAWRREWSGIQELYAPRSRRPRTR